MDRKLMAWIDQPGEQVMAAFVASAAPQRAPATRHFASLEEARGWVEAEARAFGVPVEWVDRAPGR